jgi:hypothetical protein
MTTISYLETNEIKGPMPAELGKYFKYCQTRENVAFCAFAFDYQKMLWHKTLKKVQQRNYSTFEKFFAYNFFGPVSTNSKPA